MMLCSKCNKRPAVVFLSNSTDSSATTGYCLVCAKEMGIKPVTDIMEKMGISEDEPRRRTDLPTLLQESFRLKGTQRKA